MSNVYAHYAYHLVNHIQWNLHRGFTVINYRITNVKNV